MVFYFDEMIETYEAQFQWDQSLVYLETKYLQSKDISVLNALVGYSWLYLVEGPIISGKYERDSNRLPLEYWKKYIDVGINVAPDNPYFNFVAGYTLLLNGEYLDSTYANIGMIYMEKCFYSADNLLLRALAYNVILNSNSKKYVLLEEGNDICLSLFDGNSLLDQYFCEIYST